MQQRSLSLRSMIAIIFMASFVVSCGGKQETQQEAALAVDYIELQPGAAETELKYPGTIEGVVNVDVKAQVSGYLEQIFVKEGDYVNKGQALFRIKDDVYQEQVNNSKAGYQAAIAAEQNARLEVEKIRPLVEGKVYADVQLKTAEAGHAAAKAQLAQAKAALGSSQINAGFTLIKAPVSGYIGRIPNRVGNLVTPADAVPLTTLSDISTVHIYFSLSEADFIALARQQSPEQQRGNASFILADGSMYNHKGSVAMASGNIDRATGSMVLKAIFPNPDKLLRSGGSGKIVLSQSHVNSMLIPMAAVKDIQDRYFVYTLADSGKVAMKQIQLEGSTGDQYILKSGLEAGTKVIINRIDNLNEGMKVQASPVKK